MDSAGLRWYRTGTVDITQGSANVIGVGTNWQTAGIQPGDVFMVGNSVLYEIAQVVNNTSIALHSVFQGATGTAQNYSILRNFAGTMQAQIAAQVSELVNKYESYIDTELKQITGPAGPTSFPYRGAWATGRSYNGLDVVQYGNQLYMALYGHTSTSANAPGATGTAWTGLSLSLMKCLSPDISPSNLWNTDAGTQFYAAVRNTNYMHLVFRDIPNGEDPTQPITEWVQWNGASMEWFKSDHNGTSLLGRWTADDNTGWNSLPSELTPVLYRKKNGVVFISMTGGLPGLATRNNVVGILPSNFRPSSAIRINLGVWVGSGGWKGYNMIGDILPNGNFMLNEVPVNAQGGTAENVISCNFFSFPI